MYLFLFIIRLLGTRFLFLVFCLLSSLLLLVRHCPHFPYVKELSGRKLSLFAVLTITNQLVFIEVTFPYILNLVTNLVFFLRNTADQINCSESARAESARLSWEWLQIFGATERIYGQQKYWTTPGFQIWFSCDWWGEERSLQLSYTPSAVQMSPGASLGCITAWSRWQRGLSTRLPQMSSNWSYHTINYERRSPREGGCVCECEDKRCG